MLSAYNAQIAIQKLYGPAVSVGKGIPFVRGYDNVTGGAAAIGNFNALMNPTGASLERIFYGVTSWSMYNDNLGLTQNEIAAIYYHDLPGASYAYSFKLDQTLNSAVTFFSSVQGSFQPAFVQRVAFTGRTTLFFSGYVYTLK